MNYPRLDRPIQEWTWDDVKAEMERFGADEIDEYCFAGGCNAKDTPEEFNRRITVFEYALADPEICEQLSRMNYLNTQKKLFPRFKTKFNPD